MMKLKLADMGFLGMGAEFVFVDHPQSSIVDNFGSVCMYLCMSVR